MWIADIQHQGPQNMYQTYPCIIKASMRIKNRNFSISVIKHNSVNQWGSNVAIIYEIRKMFESSEKFYY